jgi:hypothetical protein
MTGSGVYDGEMPVFPHPRYAGELPVPGVELDRLLGGELPGAPISPEIDALGSLLAAAAAPPAAHELANEAAAVTGFAREQNTDRPDTAARRPSMLATLLSTKLAAAAAAGAVTFGGVAAAAYAGALPDPIQDFAHQTVGAPSPDRGGTPESSNANEHANPGSAGQPVGPDATGPAKYGLCTAFAAEKAANHQVDTNSVAFQAVAKAAGGAQNIDAYCADATPPGTGSGQTQPPAGPDDTDDHPTGPPTEAPSGTPPTPDHPSGQPTSPPTGH